MNAIIFGAPGSGKGTCSSRLQDRINVDVIAMGDIFRNMMKKNTFLGKKIRSFVNSGMLVPDGIVLEALKTRIDKLPTDRGFILDGYPRTLSQAKELEKITKIDVIIKLEVPDWIIIERLSSRRICKKCGAVYNLRFLKPKNDEICDKCGSGIYQRQDDNPEVIKKRLILYYEQTRPLLKYYNDKETPFIVHKSKSLKVPPEEVVNFITSELKKYF